VDAPLALYRRYRPDTFSAVIGQDHVTGPLRAALRNNRVNHAYLFSGPRGCGKTTSARILARALNCARGPVEEPCGDCPSCRELATGGHGSVDVIEIDAASHGGVDDARDLREQATFRPMRDRYKIYIIDEAHMVSRQGFNALLKIVEEPPDHVRFIFATTEPDKVIGTVRSRTHHYPFRLIPPKVLTAYLYEICEREGVRVDPAALPLVIRAGGGSARDTLSVLDQLIGGATEAGVTYELAAGLLGFTPDNLLDEVVDGFSAHDGGAVFEAVDRVVETGQDPARFLDDLLRRLRDLVVVAAVPEASVSALLDVADDAAERLVAQSARFGRHDLTRAAGLVADGLNDLKGTTAPRIQLELVCARLLLPGADDSAEGLAARIDRLEKRLTMGATAPAPAPATETASAAATPEAPRQAAAPRPAPTPPQPPEPPQRPAQPLEPPQRPAQPAEPSEPTAAQGAPRLTLVDVRRLWPEILTKVGQRRRMAWILLSQHAQAIGLEGRRLTLGFNNPGARESFVAGKNDEILRQCLIDLIGDDLLVEAVIDPSARPGTAAPPPASRPAAAPDPAAGTAATPAHPGPPGPDAQGQAPDDASRDDRDAEHLDTEQLLVHRLGAQLIEEIPRE
jgi:DNA polymerase III subunit gamma/tau